mmetsp:Transcript_28813/g.63457  ORF Transcript_28813/g.63457 Transcript_28813/m.63457 type:complete len:263 (+) Transcript_28813:171-959(+)
MLMVPSRSRRLPRLPQSARLLLVPLLRMMIMMAQAFLLLQVLPVQSPLGTRRARCCWRRSVLPLPRLPLPLPLPLLPRHHCMHRKTRTRMMTTRKRFRLPWTPTTMTRRSMTSPSLKRLRLPPPPPPPPLLPWLHRRPLLLVGLRVVAMPRLLSTTLVSMMTRTTIASRLLARPRSLLPRSLIRSPQLLLPLLLLLVGILSALPQVLLPVPTSMPVPIRTLILPPQPIYYHPKVSPRPNKRPSAYSTCPRIGSQDRTKTATT